MILIGDVEVRLAELPSDHFDCVMTSPPYWGLRDYEAEGQIGLEPTMQEHIDKMVIVCAEIHRVLKPSGTFWLNYGDCYHNLRTHMNGGQPKQGFHNDRHGQPAKGGSNRASKQPGLKEKDLCMIPNRLAIALQEWGWWVRSEIVWGKPNPMPESVTDRPATAHEKIWLLTKKGRYFYDNEAVRIGGPDWKRPNAAHTIKSPHGQGFTRQADKQRGHGRRHAGFNDRWDATEQAGEQVTGRNLRNYEPAPVQVWHMATQGFPGAHFAVFPAELVERCLMAGTSQKGCCAECGAPRVRDIERGDPEPDHSQKTLPKQINENGRAVRDIGWNREQGFAPNVVRPTKTLGWSPSCACDAATVPARVLDPFGGSGTVGLVADSMGLDWTLIELNPEYAAMAEARIKSRVAGKGRKERCGDTVDLFELDAPSEGG